MKNKIINKILIALVIIISILSITYQVFAGRNHHYFNNAQSEYYEKPPWAELGEDAGIIYYDGGNARAAAEAEENPHDSGSTAVGINSSGGGGNAGGGGVWNGSIDFPVEKKIFSSASDFYPSEKGEIWFEDLTEIKKVLCTLRGTPLTGKTEYVEDEKAKGDYWVHDVDPDISPRIIRAYNYPEARDTIKRISDGDVNSVEYQKYYRTSCKYEGSEVQCNPAEAFVLSEADRVSGSGEQTPLQIAWWNIHGQGSANELSIAAKSFQDYINNAEKGASQTETINGITFTGFPIKYDPKFENTNNEYTVEFDENTQKYIIGPFKIDYYDSKPFAFINEFNIFADNSETAVDKKEYYLAVADEGDKSKLTKLEDEYPSDGEEFYIILNYNENFSKITNIKVKFQYMNAGGNYTLYTGSYVKVYVKGHIFGEYEPDVLVSSQRFFSWIIRMLMNDKAIFIQYPGAMGGRWCFRESSSSVQSALISNSASNGGTATAYETRTDISGGALGQTLLEDNLVAVSEYWYDLLVETVATLEENNTIEEHETYYNAAKSIVNTARPNDESAVIPDPVKFIIWKDLEYIPMGSFTAQTQAVARNAARWWKEVEIEWKEIVPEEGKIKITKEVDGKAKNGDVFKFKVTVDNNGEKTDEYLQITYNEDGDNSVESKVYKWEEGKKAPTYTVEEIEVPDGYTIIGPNPQTGTLTKGTTIPVKITNKVEEHSGNLSITKTIEETKLNTDQYKLTDKTYKFNVTIKGNCTFTYNGQNYEVKEDKAVVLPVEIAMNGNTSATWTLSDIKWYLDDSPEYSVEEVIDETAIPGNELVQIEPSSGHLGAGDTVNVKAINKQTTEKACTGFQPTKRAISASVACGSKRCKWSTIR